MLRTKEILLAMCLAVILCGTAHATCVCQTPEGVCYNGSVPNSHCVCKERGRSVAGTTTDCSGSTLLRRKLQAPIASPRQG